jgi:hypothetical protein
MRRREVNLLEQKKRKKGAHREGYIRLCFGKTQFFQSDWIPPAG